ncbi:hypothetical protein L0F63_001597 [Massospora cicadina]|nr:hypothetical protein L0F63_001597 [Massospora cicadina]
MIFSSRIRPVYQLSYRQLLACGGEVTCDEMWLKLSTCGMLLHVGPSCANLLGLDPKELSGASLYQFMPPDQSLTLTLSLEQACAGKASRMVHGIQNKAGKFIDVVSVLFPGSGPEPPLAKPEFILCRTKVAKFQAFHSPNSASTPAQNLFGALAFSTQTSWQYELQQLRISNRKLREEIDRLTPTPKKPGKILQGLPSKRYARVAPRARGPFNSLQPLRLEVCEGDFALRYLTGASKR